jgi:hypothetical protein
VFIALPAQANAKNTDLFVSTPNHRHHSDLRSLALPATNGDEPVDAMNLAALRLGPTKETFIEA